MDEMSVIKTLDITQLLTHLMDQAVDKKVIKVTIHGMCKLILHGIYSTRELLSKFLLMYFNPATDAEISQMLGIFLENLIKRKKQELLHDALVPTMITLLEAPYDSPLREVKLEAVLTYIIEATRPIFCSNGLNLHNTLCMKFLEIMKENPDSKEILKLFSKELSHLEIGEDPLLKKDLVTQVEQLLRDSSADVRTKKYLSDFCSMLNGTYRAPLKFSSTARTQIDDDDDGDNAIDNVEDDNENEEGGIPTISEMPEDEEATLNDSIAPDVSISNIEMKELDINVTRLDPEKINADIESRVQVNETLTEDIYIPESQPHAVINETNVEHEEIPATQDVELNSIVESELDVTIRSNDDMIPSTPATPITVVKKKGAVGNKATRKPKNSVLTEEDEEVIPATPVSTKKLNPTIKRALDISRSTPVTPSASSPLRKTARRIQSTPKSAPSSPAFASKVSTTPNSSRRSQSAVSMILSISKMSTPNTDGPKTRRLTKVEIAQNTTVTRSTSKNLNMQPRASKDLEKSSEVQKKPAPASKLPKRKVPVPAKVVPQSTRSSSRSTAKSSTADPKAKTARPPWK